MGNENQRKMLPTLQGVIESSLGVRLPSLPSPPRTLTNLDKVCAALLDVPPAHVERSGAIFEGSPQSDNLSAAFVEAMGRHLRDASNEKISAAAEGLVTDYLEKRSRRARVL